MSWWNPATWGKPAPKASYGNAHMSESDILRHFLGGFDTPAPSGMVVNENTAMKASALFGCIRILSGTIASLPCEVYRRTGDKDSELALDHPAYYLLHNEASALMTANMFWKTFLWTAFLHGDGYALIGRSPLGSPKSISWLAPHNCNPELSDDKTRLRYRIALPGGFSALFDQDDVLHWTFIGWDGLRGKSPLQCARGAVALSLAGEEFNERFFGQGSAADYAFEFPQKFDSEQAKLFYDVWERNHSGLSRQRMPIIADNGAKVTRLDFKADESQLMESRSFQVEDICRYYGVPPHMVGHTSKSTSWGSGIEEQTLAFEIYTLRNIIKGIEQEIDRKLLRSARFYCKFNIDAMLRADSKGRADFYKAALGGTQNPGFMTVNEVRGLENLPPVEGGDTLHSPEVKAGQADGTKEDNGNAAE